MDPRDLAVRIIPCLDVDDGRVVKGINFENLRDAGDPVELAAGKARSVEGDGSPVLGVDTEVIVDGYQTKDHSLKRANGRDITFTDGRKLFMGSSGTGAPGDK